MWDGKGEVYRRPWLHDLDRPRTSTRQQPQAHIDEAQEVPGEDSAWGVDRWHGLRDEEPWPTLVEGCHGREPPLEEERDLIGDILIEAGGQWLEKHDQPGRIGGEERREAIAEPRGQCQHVNAGPRWTQRRKMSGETRHTFAIAMSGAT